MAKPAIFLTADESLGKIGNQVKQEESVRLCDLRVHFAAKARVGTLSVTTRRSNNPGWPFAKRVATRAPRSCQTSVIFPSPSRFTNSTRSSALVRLS
jgi:hypothetical protein